MGTVLLLLGLLAICILGFRIMGHDIVNPIILFVLPFLIAVALGLTQYEAWQFNLHWDTVALILGSCLAFLLGAILVHFGFQRYGRGEVAFSCQEQGRDSNIRSSHLLLLLIGQIIIYTFVFLHVVSVVDAYQGPIQGDRTNVLGVYDQLTKFSDVKTDMPFALELAYLVATSIGYPLAYFGAQNILGHTKDRIRGQRLNVTTCLIMLNLFATFAGLVLTGGKAGAVWFALAIILIVFIARGNMRGVRSIRLNVRTISIIVGVGVALVLSTLALVYIVGRNMSGYAGPIGYLLIYVAGSIKNLDIYLQTDHPAPLYWGSETFKSIYSRIGLETPDAGLQTYNHIGDTWFGNVYTALADPYHDFGIFGAIVCLFLFGMVFQFIYELTFTNRSQLLTALSIVVYGYLSRAIVFAFFSNLLSTSILSFGFIVRIMVWIVVLWVVVRERNINFGRKAEIKNHLG